MEDKVEFEMLDSKLLGSDTIVYRLEDGTQVKIRVSIGRAGIAKNFKNPDGTPHYSISPNVQINIVPASKKFYIPKSRLKAPTPPKESKFKPI